MKRKKIPADELELLKVALGGMIAAYSDSSASDDYVGRRAAKAVASLLAERERNLKLRGRK